ncbi:hypothetical protein PRVXH_001896 [Proteinivorax hydrogeniformans]|uniref:Shikimate dehydrogenase substrate binding N-terminal domain-containing protein n=1 Tax=Proteinivorax hydrogeniformans TaxID=1826727 RepID=A0AAU8HS50_9FIRM
MDKYCVIGSPIDHSLSPKIHNRLFDYYGLSARYSKIDVSFENLEKVLKKLKKEGYKGFNVTYPLKGEILNLIDEHPDYVKTISSVNTVSIVNGKLIGDNTDFRGMQFILAPYKNEKIYILGSGNMANTTLYALNESGQKVTVACRNATAGESLRYRYPYIELMSLDQFSKQKLKGVTINTLPLDLDISYLFDNKNDHTVIDCNYNTSPSLNSKIKYISGLSLLYAQALKSFEIWTGHSPTMKILDSLMRTNGNKH